jgi:hypothetical protein
MALASGVPTAKAAAPPLALRWSEDATRDFYDRAQRLRWLHQLGDWTDATGRQQGRVAFAELWTSRGPSGRLYSLDVTALVRQHGADIMFVAASGALRVYAREALVGPPTLRVVRGGQAILMAATADTWLTPNNGSPLGSEPTVWIIYTALFRFPQAADPSIESATLFLTAARPHGPGRFLVMRPTPLNPAPDPPRRR